MFLAPVIAVFTMLDLCRGGNTMEGLWYAHFKAGSSQGDGMAVLQDGKILGGDPAHTYTGSYQSDGPNLFANVCISPSHAASGPVDIDHPFTVFLKGSVVGDSATVTGHAGHKTEVKFDVELHRAD
jgi:hypothetical protein